jgi:hypothetical protein
MKRQTRVAKMNTMGKKGDFSLIKFSGRFASVAQRPVIPDRPNQPFKLGPLLSRGGKVQRGPALGIQPQPIAQASTATASGLRSRS